MRRGVLFLAIVLVSLLTWESSANAQITLRFSPPDTTVAPGGGSRLSIMIDDEVDIRTIDVRVAFDTTIVRSLGGGDGALFTDSGFQLFSGFEQSAPGEWYGYTIIIGAGDFVMGPGELYYWDFEAVGEGVSPVTDVQSFMAANNGSWYDDVTITATTITVADSVSAVGDVPGIRSDLRLYPNPFNPRTEIFFDLAQSGWVELTVFDVRGRQVTVLHDGTAPAGEFKSSWNGLDASGLAQPGGVYLFRMSTPAGRSVTKGVLLK
jgi:hypothetical protein